MTAPGASAPDGSWQLGTVSEPQNLNESGVQAIIRGQNLPPWEGAQVSFRNRMSGPTSTLADVQDAQNAYRAQLDLIEGSTGHGSMAMSKNWKVPHAVWVVLPFDTQIGPMKHVSPNPTGYTLVLKKPGLWRIDALACVKGYIMRTEITYNATTKLWETKYYYRSIAVSYMIEVFRGGSLLTARQADSVAENFENLAFANMDAPRSAYFSHTFVLDIDDEDDSNQWAYVRLSMIENTAVTVFDSQDCWTYGGTARCALTASRWSQDTDNAVVAPSVPDGGNLG